MKIKCKNCGKEFKTYPSKIKLGRGKYCSRQCSMLYTNKILKKNGEKTRFIKGKSHEWHKHKSINWAGYVEVYKPSHPNATKRGYVKEHRLIMEQKLGRYLNKFEDVHHLDGDKQNNQIDNLELIGHREHTKMHNPIYFRWQNLKEVLPDALHEAI